MNVQVIKEFLELPVGEVGVVIDQQGNELIEITEPQVISIKTQIGRAMWIKFSSKDIPVGICEPFEMHVKEV